MTCPENDLFPDAKGHYGVYGGRYAAETLMPALLELEHAYKTIAQTPQFASELGVLLRDYAGRPTPLFYAQRLSERLDGARIFLKREDLTHTGAHKINNTLGQALLSEKMGKKKLIAETGAGQHGVATATCAALFGMQCKIFMGREDIRRQAPNVLRMKLLGAEVISVDSGTGTLKDAMNEALRYWVDSVRDTFYVIGSVAGPHPYPLMVRDFQRIIGVEARAQILEKTGKLPDKLIACVGGGSNAMGLFHPFLDDPVEMIGVEAAGKGIETGFMPPRSAPVRSAFCTVPSPMCCEIKTARFRKPVDLSGSGLSRRRTGARPAERFRKGALCFCDRQSGNGSLWNALPHGRHHSGPGKRPCPGLCRQRGAPKFKRSGFHRQSLGPRGQGPRTRIGNHRSNRHPLCSDKGVDS